MQTLSDNERAAIVVDFDGLGAKAVQCIDEQDARIAELEAWYARAMQDVADLNKRVYAAEKACERVRATAIRLINDGTLLGPFLGQQMLNDLEGK